MTAIADSKPFVPYAPTPRAQPAGRLQGLWLLARNPIESWTRAHYTQPILAGESPLFGYAVVVNHPPAIRRVLVDNAANYEKDPLQLRILKTGSSIGMIWSQSCWTSLDLKLLLRHQACCWIPRETVALEHFALVALFSQSAHAISVSLNP